MPPGEGKQRLSTLAARERVLGPDHPDTLASRNNLATAHRAAGRTAD
jgi:Tetratricopeptide repeat